MKKTILLCLIIVGALFFGCSNKEGKIPSNYKIGVIETTEYDKDTIVSFYDENFKKLSEKKIPHKGMTNVYDTAYIYKDTWYCAPAGELQKGTSVAVSMNINTGQIKEYDFGKEHARGFFHQAANSQAYFVCSNLNGIDRIARYDNKTKKIIEITSEKDLYTYIDADDKYVYVFVNDLTPRSNNALNDKYLILNQSDLSLVKEIPLNHYGYSFHSYQDESAYYFTYNMEESPQSYLGILDKKTLQISLVDLGETKTAMIERSGDYLFISNTDVIEAIGNKVTKFNPNTKEMSTYDIDHNVSEIRCDNENIYMIDHDYRNMELTLYKYIYDYNKDTLKEEKSKKINITKDLSFGSFYLKK